MNQVSIKFSKDTLKELEELGKRIGCQRSEIIRIAVARFIKTWGD